MMDKGTKYPRKVDRNQRKQKKRKKCSFKRRPRKPEPGKYTTTSSPELSDPDGGGSSSFSVAGQNAGIYSSTLNFDPCVHLSQIEKAPKPLSDKLEQLSKARQPKATATTSSVGALATHSDPTLNVSRRSASKLGGCGGGVRLTQILSETLFDVKNESLRWEHTEPDEEKERDRMQVYKLNRRKRYLAAANKNGNDWGLAASIPSSPQLCYTDITSPGNHNMSSQNVSTGSANRRRKQNRRSCSRRSIRGTSSRGSSCKRRQQHKQQHNNSNDDDDDDDEREEEDNALEHITSLVSSVFVSSASDVVRRARLTASAAHTTRSLPKVADNV